MHIIQQLFEIIVRKRQPQDLAYSLNAAIVTVSLTVALGTAAFASVPNFSMPFAYNITLSLAQALMIYAILALSNKSNRYVQTITALFGVSLILQLLKIVAVMVGFLSGLSLVFTIWNLVLIVLIFRAALDCSTPQAIVKTIAYHFLAAMTLYLLFPNFSNELLEVLNAVQAEIQAENQ